MKKGVILSVNKRFVTLLTPEGEFLKAKRDERAYEVGEEITFSPHKTAFTISSFQSTFRKKAVLSIATTFLILFSILPSYFTGHVSAYMTIDVNPSIELELDDQLDVLKLTGLNEDGKLVIDQLKDWKGKGIKTVTNQIVETTKQLGYLKGKKQIVVSTTLLDKDKKLDKNLKEEIKEIAEQENVSKTKMKVIQATKSERKQAKAQGISTGKYVEKKLKTNQDKTKVNKRVPDPEQDKPIEEKNATSQKQGENQDKDRQSDRENKKVNDANAVKQNRVTEVKQPVSEHLVTKPDKKNEKTNRDDKSTKHPGIKRFKEKNNETENGPGSSRSIQNKRSDPNNQGNRQSRTIERKRNNQSNQDFQAKQSRRDDRSNHARDKQKHEKANQGGKGQPSFQEKRRGREKNHTDHERHDLKKGNREMKTPKRGKDHEENRHGWNH
ncbi:anti-sigma factor domain-containing protein [Peribacillus sp. FSL E2-0218]|uniref:anti-sigma-I factor RsgI family protein n=1 Tax=Peribacillus sp. FSL E2-0218 TaxID=2921364 RepID=UPI0030EDE88C